MMSQQERNADAVDWFELQSANAKEKYTGDIYLELTFFSNVSDFPGAGGRVS